ncbi:hypothetical protein SAMN05428978_10704 [Nitrosomonas sp. Nm34]|nr:hypothetical protein SAMN05428978_10704 [Nitrosomonas sp. Nm34]
MDVLNPARTLATPTSNRAATSAIVSPSFFRTDRTLRRKSNEYAIFTLQSKLSGYSICLVGTAGINLIDVKGYNYY